jgi:hypothetical protein
MIFFKLITILYVLLLKLGVMAENTKDFGKTASKMGRGNFSKLKTMFGKKVSGAMANV